MSVTVSDAENQFKFLAQDEGAPAGYLEYLRTDQSVVYIHTEVEASHAGKGVGGALARTAMDDARRRGLMVMATCPFLTSWLKRHPEYRDLVRD